MRLQCIKLAGFKSFVDPTTVNFPSNMCAIVGPNGCGKSNIIDAVRWVMGESSAKHLRGESMADVIFNGSTGRKPVGQASIELVFDNAQGKLGGAYAAFNEISIKRRVTRDGQSDYFLNGTKCRRRDITDIFLGTGLGSRSYAIIEQGMISRLIEAKPEELRIFLEEAAGISKYKERRRDTENRMRRTRENLERLTDIRDELERQLNRLKRQARAAERYKELKQQEREYKAQYQALQWRRLDALHQEKKRLIVQQELKVEEGVTHQVSINTRMESLIEQRVEKNDTLSNVQAEYYAFGAEIARLEQVIQNQKERYRQLQDDAEQLAAGIASLQAHLSLDQTQSSAWKSELAEIEPQQQALHDKQQVSAQALQNAEQIMQDLQQRWDSFNLTANEEQRKAEVEQSRIQHYEQALDNLQQRMVAARKEQEQLVATPVEKEIAGLLEQVEHFERCLGEFEQESLSTKQTMDELRETIYQTQQSLSQKRGELEKMQGSFASLEVLQQVALGKNNHATQAWLVNHQLERQPRLAQQFKVYTGYETAVETVLGDYLQAVCVDDLDIVEPWLAELDQGRVVLVDEHSASAASSDLAQLLADKIESGEHARALLKNVYIVESLGEALRLRKRLSLHESVVTRDGIWMGASWLRVSKQSDEQLGVLARQQEMQKLAEQIAAQIQRVETQEAAYRVDRQQLSEVEVRYQQQQASQAVNSRQHAELRAQLSAQQMKIEQMQMRKSRLQDEVQQLQLQFETQQTQLQDARRTLEAALENMATYNEERTNLQLAREQNRAALEVSRQQANADRDTALHRAMHIQTLRSQLDNIVQNIGRMQTQLEQMQQRRNALESQRQAANEPEVDYQSELDIQLEKRLVTEHQLQQARQALSGVEHSIRETEQQRQQAETQTQRLRGELEVQRLAAQEDSLRCANLIEQLQAAGHTLHATLDSMPEEASEDEWQQNIEQLAQSIANLGPINLAAIDEFEIESERKLYLDAQSHDLNTALETLLGAIRKIDKETKERFKETFDNVNAGIQELFPKVFGGGSAALELTEDDDLLNSGIIIKARPPGKRNSTIHLLSGGEKALTALSLVFSIFRLNPAPFCMLDEVDAPLDDANVGRYASLISDMSKHVQFIYITHNKITMEHADQLLGVTMHEPGVSRMVTVDVQEAVDLVAV